MRTVQPRLDRHEAICEAIDNIMRAPEDETKQTISVLQQLGYEAVAGCFAQESVVVARELSYSSAWHNAGEIILAANIMPVQQEFQETIHASSIRRVSLWQHPLGQQSDNLPHLALSIADGAEDNIEFEVLQWREIGNVYGNPQRAA